MSKAKETKDRQATGLDAIQETLIHIQDSVSDLDSLREKLISDMTSNESVPMSVISNIAGWRLESDLIKMGVNRMVGDIPAIRTIMKQELPEKREELPIEEKLLKQVLGELPLDKQEEQSDDQSDNSNNPQKEGI